MKKTYSNKKTVGIVFFVLGVLLIAFSIGLAVYNSQTEKKAEETVNLTLSELDPVIEERKEHAKRVKQETQKVVPDYELVPEMPMPAETYNGQNVIGVIDIPTIGLHMPVQSTLTQRNLSTSACRLSGTVYNRDIIIGAHNYKTYFGYIKTLTAGDKMEFTDMEGNVFEYKVAYTEILSPYQYYDFTNGDWDLTLFTCTVGARARVIVRFDLIEKTEE